MAEKFADLSPSAAYSSPMTRCKQTLAPFLQKAGIELIEDMRLREVDMPFNQDKAFDATTWTWNDEPVDSENAPE